jgi:SAM-dependent methyltransferase
VSAARRALGWPLRRALDPRALWTISEIDYRLGSHNASTPSLHARIDELEGLTRHLSVRADLERRAADEALAALLDGIRALDSGVQSLDAGVETVDGDVRSVGGAVRSVDEALRSVARRLEERTGYTVPPLDDRALGDLRWPVAELVNWANGPEGYAAQGGLWFNPPVQVALDAGGARPLSVNERIVEVPFVFGALAELAPGSAILDVGGAESTVAHSLAALGHDVTVVDPRGYELAHPRLCAVAAGIEDLDAEPASFDAAIVLSTLEHLGTGAYGQPTGDGRPDLDAMGRVRELLRPGGVLALTLPLGAPAQDGFQRGYDRADLDELLAAWDVRRSSLAWRGDATTWDSGPLEDHVVEPGVALVVAER